MFCPKCGALMKKEGDALVCPKCGEKKKLENTTFKFNENNKQSLFRQAEEKYPTTVHECPKCHNKEVYYIVRQTRSADEAPTVMYKCTKCGYQWREY